MWTAVSVNSGKCGQPLTMDMFPELLVCNCVLIIIGKYEQRRVETNFIGHTHPYFPKPTVPIMKKNSIELKQQSLSPLKNLGKL